MIEFITEAHNRAASLYGYTFMQRCLSSQRRGIT